MQAVHRAKTLGRRRSHHLTTRTPAALTQGTNQARRGSRKRPDPPCGFSDGPGLATTRWAAGHGIRFNEHMEGDGPDRLRPCLQDGA